MVLVHVMCSCTTLIFLRIYNMAAPTEAILSVISNLDYEFAILSKLLYRNKNQHGNTKVYKFFSKMEKLLHRIGKKSLTRTFEVARRIASTCNTDLHGHRFSQEKFDEGIGCYQQLNLLIEQLTEVSYWCRKAGAMSRQHLSDALFMTLYSVLFALSASMMKSTGIIAMYFDDQCSALQLLLRRVAATSQASAIQVHLIDVLLKHSLTAKATAILRELHRHYNTSSGLPPPHVHQNKKNEDLNPHTQSAIDTNNRSATNGVGKQVTGSREEEAEEEDVGLNIEYASSGGMETNHCTSLGIVGADTSRPSAGDVNSKEIVKMAAAIGSASSCSSSYHLLSDPTRLLAESLVLISSRRSHMVGVGASNDHKAKAVRTDTGAERDFERQQPHSSLVNSGTKRHSRVSSAPFVTKEKKNRKITNKYRDDNYCGTTRGKYSGVVVTEEETVLRDDIDDIFAMT